MAKLAFVQKQQKIALGPWLREKILQPKTIQVAWAGQAGFIIKSSDLTVGIDLYLSNSLAEKYKGKEFPHRRMIDPPLTPQECRTLNIVLCTHGHTDHMDPQTLAPLYAKGGGPLCIGPRYEAQKMLDIGLPAPKTVGLNAGEVFALETRGKPICMITAIPAAHEEITVDAWGNTKALGYLIELDEITIYHSGDSILYDGLLEILLLHKPDLVLLPVNGKREHLSAKGVLGNFSSDEASNFAKEAGASFFIPHHFGMFDFNTVTEESIDSSLKAHGWVVGTDALIPKLGEVYTFQ